MLARKAFVKLFELNILFCNMQIHGDKDNKKQEHKTNQYSYIFYFKRIFTDFQKQLTPIFSIWFVLQMSIIIIHNNDNLHNNVSTFYRRCVQSNTKIQNSRTFH